MTGSIAVPLCLFAIGAGGATQPAIQELTKRQVSFPRDSSPALQPLRDCDEEALALPARRLDTGLAPGTALFASLQSRHRQCLLPRRRDRGVGPGH